MKLKVTSHDSPDTPPKDEHHATSRSERRPASNYGLVATALIFTVRIYQAIIRPHLRGSCRFHPTCSEYAIEALSTHTLRRGLIFLIKRLCRCHPFSTPGFDPVPDQQDPLRRVDTRGKSPVQS
jgi:hypothetical protein